MIHYYLTTSLKWQTFSIQGFNSSSGLRHVHYKISTNNCELDFEFGFCWTSCRKDSETLQEEDFYMVGSLETKNWTKGGTLKLKFTCDQEESEYFNLNSPVSDKVQALFMRNKLGKNYKFLTVVWPTCCLSNILRRSVSSLRCCMHEKTDFS